jgi:hypothetical protein
MLTAVGYICYRFNILDKIAEYQMNSFRSMEGIDEIRSAKRFYRYTVQKK